MVLWYFDGTNKSNNKSNLRNNCVLWCRWGGPELTTGGKKAGSAKRTNQKEKAIAIQPITQGPLSLLLSMCTNILNKYILNFTTQPIIWVVVMLSLYTTAKKTSGLGDQLSMKQVFRNTWFWLPRNMWTAHKVFVYNKDVLRNGSNGHLFCPNNSSQSKECPGVRLFLCIHTGLDYMFTSSSSEGRHLHKIHYHSQYVQ